jgi:hypothetical protein
VRAGRWASWSICCRSFGRVYHRFPRRLKASNTCDTARAELTYDDRDRGRARGGVEIAHLFVAGKIPKSTTVRQDLN